jgi:hypothetical protein
MLEVIVIKEKGTEKLRIVSPKDIKITFIENDQISEPEQSVYKYNNNKQVKKVLNIFKSYFGK